MRVVFALCLAAVVVPITAFGADPHLATADVNVQGTSAVTLVSATGGGSGIAGSIRALACRVTTAISSGSSLYFTVQLDSGTSLTLNVYSTGGGTSWHTDVLPFANASNGANVGDQFVFPFNASTGFQSSLTVTAHPGGPFGGGHLRCSAVYYN